MSNFGSGIVDALTLSNLIAALVGAILGTAVGVLPGLSPTAVLGLLLPVVVDLKAETGLIFLLSVYFGTQYGDSLSAILMNVPSESAAVVIARDGYKLTQRGRASTALTVAAVGSFIGALIGVLCLAVVGPAVSSAALAFGPPEFVGLIVLGAVVLVRLGSESIWKNAASLCAGMLLTVIGSDPETDAARFTFGSIPLLQGIDVVAVAIGLFGLAEVISLAMDPPRKMNIPRIKLRSLALAPSELRDTALAAGRGGVLGFILGILPGPALTLATFIDYRLETWLHRKSATPLGEGAVSGVAGPKAADDAGVSGSIVPIVVLGLPFTPVTTVLFAGFLIVGVQPGPDFISQNGQLFWAIIGGLVVVNCMLLILNLPFVAIWVNILRIPAEKMAGLIFVLVVIGAFTLRNSMLDVVVAMLSGLAGIAMRKYGFERALLILGLVLGSVLETSLRQSVEGADGHLMSIVLRPISGTFFGLAALVLLWPVFARAIRRRRTRGIVVPDPIEPAKSK